MEVKPYLLNYIKNVGKGGTMPTGEIEITENGTYDVTNYATANVNVASTAPIIANCQRLFSNNWRTDIVNQLLPQCKPTNAKGMFLSSTNITDLVVMDLSDIETPSDVSDMFNGCSNLTNDSLNNILASILTITSDTFFPKELSRIGLSSTQATTCTTLSNWSACESAGWSTGY